MHKDIAEALDFCRSLVCGNGTLRYVIEYDGDVEEVLARHRAGRPDVSDDGTVIYAVSLVPARCIVIPIGDKNT